jgi:tellurite resistance protein TehA-like permease
LPSWAMMLMGFGGIGFAMRRARRGGRLLPQAT